MSRRRAVTNLAVNFVANLGAAIIVIATGVAHTNGWMLALLLVAVVLLTLAAVKYAFLLVVAITRWESVRDRA